MIDTFIAGIPCTVKLQFHEAHFGAREAGSGFQLEPDEPAGNEIIGIFKRGGKGQHMQWLEDKMTDEERERIERGGN